MANASPLEDLMKEHGIIRRILLIYRESIPLIKEGPGWGRIDPNYILTATKLFRTFGEDHHEREMEQGIVFPMILDSQSSAKDYINILIKQHDRSREVTDFISTSFSAPSPDVKQISQVIESLDIMYGNHAAREDTVVFPVWAKTLSDAQLEDIAGAFEKLEEQRFGEGAYEEAAKTVAEIERSLGFSNISKFTSPRPPKAKTKNVPITEAPVPAFLSDDGLRSLERELATIQ